jgi:RimJ/RimL family protein N-acetyltransferase
MPVPPLETERLLIRAFRLEDLDVIHHILDIELRTADFGSEQAKTREERERWLQWTVLSYDELARLYQPPYGDRAMVLKSTQQVIGACGFVPSLGPFGHLPSLHAASQDALAHLYSPEFGLYYALSPAYQRQGYATEAAQALINYAFTQLHQTAARRPRRSRLGRKCRLSYRVGVAIVVMDWRTIAGMDTLNHILTQLTTSITASGRGALRCTAVTLPRSLR